MALALDPNSAYAAGNPVLFWVNRDDPFVIGSQSAAYSGRVASQRLVKTDLIGAPMIVQFIIAKASHIAAWKLKVTSNPFNTTTLHSSFITGHNVIFQFENPIVYKNMVLKDGLYDIDQDIFTYGNLVYKRGLDVWEGTMKFFITS